MSDWRNARGVLPNDGRPSEDIIREFRGGEDAILAGILRRLLTDTGYISDRRLYIGSISDYGADVSDTEAEAIRRVLHPRPD